MKGVKRMQFKLLMNDLGKIDIEKSISYKKMIAANRKLAELKGVANTLPNKLLLINTLTIQEAKESSEIEQIITTQDEVYRNDYTQRQFETVAAKEVQNYARALLEGYNRLLQVGVIRESDICIVQQLLEENAAGYRSAPGTVIKNDQTGEVVYTPPQKKEEIILYMRDLEFFINNDQTDWDPLTKMAVIHHQFESIHPFFDGNGRTGRILNILYLVKEEMLELPILYLSRYINRNKGLYYKYLQEVRDTGNWTNWIHFFLDGVSESATETLLLIKDIMSLMQEQKQLIRKELPDIYSQELLNNIFNHPYTKVEYLQRDLSISRPTATSYLNKLEKLGVVELQKHGRKNFYLHKKLWVLLIR